MVHRNDEEYIVYATEVDHFCKNYDGHETGRLFRLSSSINTFTYLVSYSLYDFLSVAFLRWLGRLN